MAATEYIFKHRNYIHKIIACNIIELNKTRKAEHVTYLCTSSRIATSAMNEYGQPITRLRSTKGLPSSDSPLRSHTVKVLGVRPNVCASTLTIPLINSAMEGTKGKRFSFLPLLCVPNMCVYCLTLKDNKI